jgi:lysophospholipase L1-like esterase
MIMSPLALERAGACPPEENGGAASKTVVTRSSKLIIALLISFALNMIALAAIVNVVAGRGGVAYLKARLLHDAKAIVDPSYTQRESLFQAIKRPPGGAHPVVFLGDSLTAGCEWRELFGNRLLILNRGIGGDTSAGVLNRSAEVAALKPRAVFLMIGTNDLQEVGYSPADTARNYRAIVKTLRDLSPRVHIYLESILPTQSPKFNRWSERVNQEVRNLADGNSIVYLNLRDAFLENGALGKSFTIDGTHLNGNGYLLWKKQIDPIITELSRGTD